MPKRGTNKSKGNGADSEKSGDFPGSASNQSKKVKKDSPGSDWTVIFDNNVNKKTFKNLEDIITEQFLECMNWTKNRTKTRVIRNIIQYISVRYNANNYHNFHHASHVTLNCACALRHTKNEIPPIERLSLLFSALIHDVDHFGVPNAYLVKTSHELALLYNDQSVAENHSLAIGLDMLRKPGFELLDGFSEEEIVLFRHNVIELVLCTDIADPIKKLMTCVKLDMLSKTDEDTGKIGALDVSTTSGRVSFMSLTLRVCDIGANAQSFHTQQIWTHRLFLEQKEAAAKDNTPFVGIDFFYSDQVCFMSHHVLPQLQKLRDTGGMEDDFMAALCENVTNNIDQWKEQGEAMLKEWDDDSIPPKFD